MKKRIDQRERGQIGREEVDEGNFEVCRLLVDSC